MATAGSTASAHGPRDQGAGVETELTVRRKEIVHILHTLDSGNWEIRVLRRHLD